MTLHISSVFTYDEDAGNYIQAVEAADGQALESATRKAINNFVIGCKQDGIWDAIKASCILAGARTLNGALVPLANASSVAPTLNGTAGGWNYNRKTGLAANGTDNYINSGRNNNADPQDSQHLSAFPTTANTSGVRSYIGAGGGVSGSSNLYSRLSDSAIRSRSSSFLPGLAMPAANYLFGLSRTSSAAVSYRLNASSYSWNTTSQIPFDGNVHVFNINGYSFYSDARLAFYSIGESLDLAKLDGRVTDLITAFGAAIP